LPEPVEDAWVEPVVPSPVLALLPEVEPVAKLEGLATLGETPI
jgi:hypothetical protein